MRNFVTLRIAHADVRVLILIMFLLSSVSHTRLVKPTLSAQAYALPLADQFQYPLTGAAGANRKPYGVANPGLEQRDTCFGKEGHQFNELTHAGEDWFRPIGTPVFPVAAGRVYKVVPWDHGQAIIVEHQLRNIQPWGTDRIYSVYLHIRNPLPEGTEVHLDSQLAEVNEYGTSNHHLHWELRRYASMMDSPLPTACKSLIGPSYTDTGTDPADFGYTDPVAWVEAHKHPSGPSTASLDLVFAIDSTGSMADDIAAVKAQARLITNQIKERTPDSRMAVMDFRDFPTRTASSSDYPYRDIQAFTSDATVVVTAIDSISLGNGGDTPETRNCALMHAIRNDRCASRGAATTIGSWRPIQSKAVIVLTDAPALSPEPFTGFTNESVVAVANTGGTEICENGPCLTRLSVEAAESSARGITFYPIIVGDDSQARADAKILAEGTGGAVFTAATADDVVDAILQAIDDITEPAALYLPLVQKVSDNLPPFLTPTPTVTPTRTPTPIVSANAVQAVLPHLVATVCYCA